MSFFNKRIIKILYFFNLFLVLTFIISCSNNKVSKKSSEKLFQKIESNISGISFNNKLTETNELNYFNYSYIYMGGGISVGDFNNDNLTDIYFTGNMVGNKMYLNQGDLHFKDVAKISNSELKEVWSSGTTTVDINNDGLLDIYVSVSGKNGPYKNKLLVNQGVNKSGIPIFKEEAEHYNIADEGRSQQSVFFDYDNDGDLDLYVINYPITDFKISIFYYQAMLKNPLMVSSSHLYRNNGDLTFTNVTQESGLLSFGLSIGISVADLDKDGFKDIYVSNDFASPDFIYFNNGDGTFSERSKEVTKQTSFYGMGIDIADFNNDGLLDIVQLDMSPSSHKRSKENMASMDPLNFQEIVNSGLHHQYMYNTLQLNRGFKKDSLPVFSNIAAFSGVKSTDWSWAALLADFDNDGYKDLFVSNGTRRDIHNNDFFSQFKKNGYFGSKQKHQKYDYKIIEKMPSEPLANFLFSNNKNLTFTNKSDDWGLGDKNFSNGAAYADFDNDGDLDLVVSNIDSEVGFYENTSNNKESSNYLKIVFNGTEKNKLGIGNTVTIYKNGKLQLSELMLTRGYQSSMEPILYFGVQNESIIDSLTVQWTDGSIQKLINIKTNQTLVLDYKNAIKNTFKNTFLRENKLFTDITNETDINFIHQENDYFDYNKEPLLPHKMSQFGPGLTVGDVNGDKLDDFWVGGALYQAGELYIQDQQGKFKKSTIKTFENDKNYEDLDGLFFDADNDGDLDLYVVSGGNEFQANHKQYQDRIYINDGRGNFIKNETAIPQFYESGAKVIPIDFDKDGDLDLFVASRLTPQNYPTPATSYLLENVSTKTNVQFKDITGKSKSTFKNLGLVTDAIAIDFDNDNDDDLIVVGEWMPITFLENDNNTFKNITDKNILKNTVGWWYSIEKSDLDNDGDLDFIVGNLGLNYKYKASPEKTFDVFANDFDNNKSQDIVLGYYEGKRQLPVRGRECSSQQVPGIKNKFKNFEKFANADLVDIYTEDKLKNGIHYKAQTFASITVENLGNGKFKSIKLPTEAQFSSINTILIDDYTKDGNKDILVAGNLFVSEAETPRNDASIGQLLTNKGINSVSLNESGFLADKDVKNMKTIRINGNKCILVANNNSVLLVFKINTKK